MGVVLAEFLPKNIVNKLFVVLVAFVVLLFFSRYWLHRITKDRILSAIICVVLISSGILFTQIKFTKYLNAPIDANVICTVCRIEKSDEKKTTLLVRSDVAIDTVNKKDVLFLVHIQDSIVPEILPGYQILIEGVLFPFEKALNPEQFDYRKYMLSKGISHQCFVKDAPEVIRHSPKQIKVWSALVQYKLLKRLRHPSLSEEHFSVVAALVLGNKTFLDKDLRKSYASAGAMHVLAVSGLHVGIIFLILNRLLFFLDKRKKGLLIKAVIIIVALWSYAFITGLSPSVMRSATMFSIVSAGIAFRKQSNIYNTIFISAFLLLLINPLLIFDVGFQLSYAAVLSIVFFQPKIVSVFEQRTKFGKWLWQLFAVSIAAQLGTFPIAIFYFHQFPVYFWLSNFIVIPLAGVLIYTSVAYLLLAGVVYVSTILAFLLKVTISVLNLSVTTIENLPHAVINNIMIDEGMVLLFYGIIVSMGVLIVSKDRRFVHLLILLFCIVFFKQLYVQVARKDQLKMVVYYHYKYNNLSFLFENQSIHLTDNANKYLPAYVVQYGIKATGDVGEIHNINKKVIIENEKMRVEKINNYCYLISFNPGNYENKNRNILYYVGSQKYFKYPLGDINQVISKYELNINSEIPVHCLCRQGCYVLDMRSLMLCGLGLNSLVDWKKA